MKCRFHPWEGNLVGVCALCLRQRLEELVAEKERWRRVRSSLSSTSSSSSSSANCRSSTIACTTTATVASCPEFPLPFQSSASPYVAARDRRSLFFSPPQLKPTAKKEKNKSIHRPQFPKPNSDHDRSLTKDKTLSFLSSLFGRRKKPKDSHARAPVSSSLFSKILPCRHPRTPPTPGQVQPDFLPSEGPPAVGGAGGKNDRRRREDGRSDDSAEETTDDSAQPIELRVLPESIDVAEDYQMPQGAGEPVSFDTFRRNQDFSIG